MAEKDMIAWFIKELGFSHDRVVDIINSYPSATVGLNAKDIKQMMLGRREWPEDTWDALRYVTSHLIGDVQKRVEALNQIKARKYTVAAKELSSSSGRLGVLMACILLEGNTPVVLE